MTTRGLIRANGRYRRVFTATAISALGDGVQVVAFPLLGTTLTRSPSVIAWPAAAGAIPSLLLALPAGALIDRLDRGRLLAAIDFCRAAVTALIAIAVFSRTIRIWELFVFALALGVGELVFDTGAMAYLPSIVDRAEIGPANGQLNTVGQLFNGLIGPAVGGVVFAAVTNLPFSLNACSFLISALLIRNAARTARGGPRAETGPAAPRPAAAAGFPAQIAQGVRWMAAKRSMRSLLYVVAVWNLLGWMPEAILVLYAQRDLGLGGFGYGLLFAATSVGAVIGGLLSSWFIRRLGTAAVLQLSVLVYAALMFPAALLHSRTLVIAAFVIQGVPLIGWSVVTTTIRQTLVPDALLGRVGSLFRLLSAGLSPSRPPGRGRARAVDRPAGGVRGGGRRDPRRRRAEC